MQFNFNFGTKKLGIKEYAILTIVLTSIIGGLSSCTKLPQNFLWDLLDEISRRYFPQGPVNKFIIQEPKRLDRRVKRDVGRAIDLATPEYDRIIHEADKKYQPHYVEEKTDESKCYTDACKALAPPMRICAPWVEDCPKDAETLNK